MSSTDVFSPQHSSCKHDSAFGLSKTFYKFLTFEKKVYIISKQLLRSGTSIGANISEAAYAQSRADFINKMQIALKEASETCFWIALLYNSDIIDQKTYESLDKDIRQILGTLVKIVNSTKNNEK
ncbi:MAG: four helix bundle protein [Bacteroidaceae bacterium]|nr:four helix bundle protein [Bacteroidaceae bacterium]MBR4649017.1 four helix bundle protein [Bacteroidaceae bacterium]